MRLTMICRAIRRLEAEGYSVEKTRRAYGSLGKRYRPFAFLDLLGLKEGQPPLAIFLSSTSWNRIHAERRLLAELPAVRAWLAAGCSLQLWAFTKRNQRYELTRLSVRPEGGMGKNSVRFLPPEDVL